MNSANSASSFAVTRDAPRRLAVEGFCVAGRNHLPRRQPPRSLDVYKLLASSTSRSSPDRSTVPVKSSPLLLRTHLPIIHQSTGGCASGHRSYEDLLSTYSVIRQYLNISSIAGSGQGRSKDVSPYITGEWYCADAVRPMSSDSVLFASLSWMLKSPTFRLPPKPSFALLLMARAGSENEPTPMQPAPHRPIRAR